jgi:hypothetical protein
MSDVTGDRGALGAGYSNHLPLQPLATVMHQRLLVGAGHQNFLGRRPGLLFRLFTQSSLGLAISIYWKLW